MKIPTFTGYKVSEKDGTLHPEFQQYHDQLNKQMQLNLSDDGLVVPSNTTTDINNFANNTNPNSKPNGTFWYDNQTHQIKVKIAGIVKVVPVV